MQYDPYLDELLNDHYVPSSSKITSEATIRSYRNSLAVFGHYWRQKHPPNSDEPAFVLDAAAPVKPRLSDLTDRNISEAMRWVRKRPKGNSVGTANRMYRVLTALWRFAHAERWREDLPRVKPFDEPKRERRTWLVKDYQNLLTSAGATPGTIVYDRRGRDLHTRHKVIPASTWWTGLLVTIGLTGARISAVMACRWRQVDFGRNVIQILAEDQKHDMDQTFELSHECKLALSVLRAGAGDEEFVFPWPLDGGANRTESWSQLLRHYRRILKRAGLRDTSKDLFHAIRAMVATWIANAEGERAAQDYLGHSHISVTRRYLDRSQMDTRRTAVRILPAFEIAPQSALRVVSGDAG